MNKLPKLSVVASKDELRPKLHYILIENGYAVATDANILAACDLEHYLDDEVISALDGYLINRDHWKELEKGKWECLEVVGDNLEVTDPYGSITVIPLKQNNNFYPNWKTVFPRDLHDTRLLPNISLNTKLLQVLGTALDPYNWNKEGNILQFYGEGKGVVVINPITTSFGMIMPNKINENDLVDTLKQFDEKIRG